MGRTAIVFGATGLVGTHLTRLLAAHNSYRSIVAFVRSIPAFEIPGVSYRVFDPGRPDEWKQEVAGDDLFCCLGTTIKKAGSREKFEEADLHLPVKIAHMAAENGMKRFLVVSSIGANAGSSNFYLRTKGRMEEGIRSINGLKTVSLRPSMLLGKRKEFRLGEEVGKALMKVLGFLMAGPLKKYRGIHAERVAGAMIALALQSDPPLVVESDQLSSIAKSHKNI